MKQHIFIVVAAAWFLQGCDAFATVRPKGKSASLTSLGYEREDVHDLLEQGARVSASTPTVRADGSMALPYPTEQEVSPQSSYRQAPAAVAEIETGFQSSYQGLTNPSKAGLVLATALTFGMVAASPEIDVSAILDFPQLGSLSGDASAVFNAGMMAMERALQDAQMDWSQISSNIADAQWMQLALAKLATWKEAAASIDVEALRASILNSANGLQRESLAAWEASKDSAAAMAQSSQAALADASIRWSELQSEALQDAQVWTQALSSNLASCKEALQDSMAHLEANWIDACSQLSEAQKSWMQDAQVWANTLDQSRQTLAQNIELNWNDASLRFASAQNNLMQDTQVWNQQLMSQVDAWKASATAGVEGAQASWADTTSQMSYQFQDFQGNSQEQWQRLLATTDSATADMQRTAESTVNTWMNSLTLGMDDVQNTWTETSNRVSSGFQDMNIQEKTGTVLQKLSASKDSILSRVSGWMGNIPRL
eukprot:scaffold4529_cov121-Cylindrotheca_fusiformis.AAC.4